MYCSSAFKERGLKDFFYRHVHGNIQEQESKTLSEGEIRRIRFVNYLALISIANMTSYIVLYVIIDASLFLPAILLLSFSSLISIGLIILNNGGFRLSSKVLIALLNLLSIGSISTWIFGNEPGFHTFLFITIVIPLFLWSAKELKYLLLFSGLSLFLYVYIEFAPQLFNPLIELPVDLVAQFKSSNILITFCTVALAIFVYFELSSRQEKRLLQQAEELERSQQHRDLVYSIIAHDLRSPIAKLLGITDLMLRLSDKKDASPELDHLEKIYNSSKSLNNLLDNLLNWSKMHSGNMVVNSKPFGLSTKVDETEKLLHDLIHSKDITFTNRIDPEVMALADDDMLATVLRNLISNAIKFTPTGGKIQITCAKTKGVVKVCIQDTGVGISSENLSILFDEKIHLSTFDTNKEKGSGLGIKLCKDFIEANHGEIWAESEQGKGSKFFFTLSLASANHV